MTLAVVYPGAIARACASLDESPIFRDTPDGYLRVIIRIIKKINLSRLNAPIVASRSTLATESGKSIETVGRAIKWLEDKGLIERTQKARAGLRGSSSPLIPTTELLKALLLNGYKPRSETTPAAESVGNASYPQIQPESAVKPDASKSVEYNNLSENSSRKRDSFTKIDGLTIPSDLAWMTKNGLKPSGVLSLMKQAKLAKQRLSDVVAVAQQYLRPLHGRALYAYVRALLSKDRDYTYIRNKSTQEAQEHAQEERVSFKATEMVGRHFRNQDDTAHYIVQESGLVLELRGETRLCRRFDEGFLLAIENRRLLPIAVM